MKGALPLFALNTILFFAASTQADQLSPVPEAGLWRSETRFLVNGKDYQQPIRAAPQSSSDPVPHDRRSMDSMIILDSSGTRMECITPQQAADMIQLQSIQRELQREIPECELQLSKADRSKLVISGACNGENGFYGDMQGELEVITSYEIRSAFAGKGRVASSDDLPPVGAGPVELQQKEILRWTAADCGSVAPSERLSF